MILRSVMRCSELPLKVSKELTPKSWPSRLRSSPRSPVRGLGADQVIDYKVDDFSKLIADCDVVFEALVQTGGLPILSVF